MKKYKYYIICIIAIGLLFYGSFNINNFIGMSIWGIGLFIAFTSTLLQIIKKPNFEKLNEK